MRRPKKPKPASRARSAAINIPASAIPPSPCSRSAWRRWKARRWPAPRPPAWRRCRRCSCPACKTGDHVVAAQGHVRLLPACGGADPAALRHRPHPGGWRRYRRLGSGHDARDQACCSWRRRPIPTLVASSISKAVAQDRRQGAARGWWWTMPLPRPALQRPMEFGADIVVHSSTKYIDGQGRALGGVILCEPGFPGRSSAGLPAQHRPVDQPVQCLAASEEPGDAGPAHEGSIARMRRAWPISWPASKQGDAGALSLPPRSSAAQSGPRPDGRRRRRGGVRGRQAARRRRSSWPMR